MTGDSLDAGYFDGIFQGDADPWGLASSAYEAAKFDATIAVIADRRYHRALEIGCAHGVLSERLSGLCDDMLAVDISSAALAQAAARLASQTNVRLDRLAFPREAPAETGFDLVILSEVAYYWSDADLVAAAALIGQRLVPGGRLLLVHWLGDTDYPQSGDGAVRALRAAFGDLIETTVERRTSDYRLDLWTRR